MAAVNSDQPYDRLTEVKQFDDSKLGVKGLLDTGISAIPRFFHVPPESRPTPKSMTRTDSGNIIPTVDLSLPRSVVVDEIRRAASTVGFFQVTNHGIPDHVISRAVAAVRAFNEQPAGEKAAHYRRGPETGFSFSSNVDLYQSKAASWRDSIQMRLGPVPPNPEIVPDVVREEIFEWDREVRGLGEVLMGLLSEGLGVETGKLKEMKCLEGRAMAAHYYPHCPQPDLTYGLTPHTDPGVITIVLQNAVGGLQVKKGDEWVFVEPVPGGLVINVGDILQIMSNDEYKSVEHRVLANDQLEPRVSIAVFFNTSDRERLFGPLPELTTPEKPARYRQFTLSDFMGRFFRKELDGNTLTDFYRVRETSP